jgi:hypothetical protein
MNKELFETIIQNRLEDVRKRLLLKGEEYIRNEDMLHNFNRAAEMRRTTSLEALQGFLDKHLVSWLDIVDDIAKAKSMAEIPHITRELINEKLGDIICYFFLAECAMDDLIDMKPKSTNYKEHEE